MLCPSGMFLTVVPVVRLVLVLAVAPVSAGGDTYNCIHWGYFQHLLDPEPSPVPEPENEGVYLRPPTEMDAGRPNPKHGYSEVFDRHPFSGTTEKMSYMIGRPRKNTLRMRRSLSKLKQQTNPPEPEVKERIMVGP